MPAKTKRRGARKESKVQIRLRPSQKELIVRAAEVKQTTLSGFMVDNALSAAQQVLAEQVHFSLPPERWNQFCAALDAPPKDIPALRDLMNRPSIFDDQAT